MLIRTSLSTLRHAFHLSSPATSFLLGRMTRSNMTTEINKDTSNVASTSSTKQVPPGFTVHREASAEVLLADGRDVFINPIQEFNRDLSSLVIRTWSEVVNEERRAVWERKRQAGIAKKGKKRKHDENGEQEQVDDAAVSSVAEVGLA